MKCTLRKVENGIVVTVDERPEYGEYCYDKLHNDINYFDESRGCYSTDHKILASTIKGVGMELVIPEVWLILENEPNTEHEYTIENDKLIIKL